MKTKLDFNIVTQKEINKRMKYGEYQKAFAKDLNRVKTGDKEKCVVITKYEFADKKKRPLMVLGITPEWKDYCNKESKTNKYFAVGEAELTVDTAGKNSLALKINKGKVSDAEISKSFKKYSPVGNLSVTLGAKELVGVEQVGQLENEAGFKLFSKSTFAKIKAKLKEYKTAHSEEYEIRLGLINELKALIATWNKKHSKLKSKTENAKHKELLKIDVQLTKAFASIMTKFLKVPDTKGDNDVVEKVLNNKVLKKAFTKFAKNEFNAENIEAYDLISDLTEKTFKTLFAQYLRSDGKSQVNISNALKEKLYTAIAMRNDALKRDKSETIKDYEDKITAHLKRGKPLLLPDLQTFKEIKKALKDNMQETYTRFITKPV